MIRRVLIAIMLTVALPAHAEDIVGYEAEGDAPAAGADPRVAALDDAFARAVVSAIGDLVSGDVRTAHKAELDREIVGHARLWVAKFTVTRDETNEARRQLTVSVRIDRDKIRARLGELDIATHDPSAPPDGPPSHTVTILLRVTTPAGVHADYGPAADKDVPGLAGLTALLRDAGMAVRRAPASGVAPKPQGELPLDDGEAAALADGAKAELAAIVGVTVGPPVMVRGQAVTAALVTVRIRLIAGTDKKLIGEGTAVAAARGDDLAYAVDHALAAAMTDVMPPAPKRLAQAGTFKGDDTPIAEPGIVLVRLSAKTPYHMVLDEQRYLAGARGVHAATLRRLSPNGWVIGVATSDSIEKVAQIAKKPPATDTSASVKIVGDVVDVALSGSP